ncbi:hypothetical protein C0V97_01120 [Asaia sp. W19]|uniref:hypothetical protein n=1 Tax=Asaia TaxID=91914 RepID=UPI000EFD6697|nr:MULTISPECIES: hypothetical protein [Asaia]RUT27400.1 hypothetical protein C0V97_01120 [Asaia sp. W19]
MDFDPTRPSVHHEHAHVTPQVLDASERADKPVTVDMRPKLPEGARWNTDGTVTIALDEPAGITRRSGEHEDIEQIREITCRRLRGGDMIDAVDAEGASGRQLFLLKRMTGLEDMKGELFIRALSHADYLTLVEVLGVFTRRGQKTGR